MLKRYMLLAVATVFFAFQLFAGSASAKNLAPALRTVPLDSNGGTVIFSQDQLDNGQSQFNETCAICHVGGDTKTNPTINLSAGALAGATPSRNTVEGLVDYLNNPTTYDGFEEIFEVHPSTRSIKEFPEMGLLNPDDLTDIAGHILVQPKILGDQWGGGKTTR